MAGEAKKMLEARMGTRGKLTSRQRAQVEQAMQNFLKREKDKGRSVSGAQRRKIREQLEASAARRK